MQRPDLVARRAAHAGHGLLVAEGRSSTRRRKVWKTRQAAELALLAAIGVVRPRWPGRASRLPGRWGSRAQALGAPVFQAKRMFAAAEPELPSSGAARPAGEHTGTAMKGPATVITWSACRACMSARVTFPPLASFASSTYRDARSAVSLVVPLVAQVRHAAGVVGVGVVVRGDAEQIGVGGGEVPLAGARPTIDGVGARELVVGDAEEARRRGRSPTRTRRARPPAPFGYG